MTIDASTVRAGIYCRISDDREGGGLGVERQSDDCLALAEKLGWKVVDTFVDNDISASTGKWRGDYERLIADITSGRINAVLTWHLDRLNRSPLELEHLIDVLDRNRVDVHAVTAGLIDLTTPTGRMVARVVGAMARHESDLKSVRVRREKLTHTMAGEVVPGAFRSFGYAKNRITIVPKEAAVIREAMARFLGGESISNLCRDFTARGVRGTQGRPFKNHHLANLLISARIAGWRSESAPLGTWAPFGMPFIAPAQWNPIVSRGDVEAVRALLADDTRRPGSQNRFLLAGIVLCGRCQQPMAAAAIYSGRMRYKCQTGPFGRNTPKCGRMSIIADRLEYELLNQIRAAVKGGLVRRILAADGEQAYRPGTGDSGVTDPRPKQTQSYDSATMSREEWKLRRLRVARINRATREVAADMPSVQTLRALSKSRRAFDAEWDMASMRERRALVRALTTTVALRPAGADRARWNPERVQITWRA